MPKMHQKTFGGRALPGPAGELKRYPKPPSRYRGASTSKGKKGRGRKGEGGKRKVGRERKGKRKGETGREKGREKRREKMCP